MPFAFNPNLVTNAAGTFSVDNNGYIAGLALDDPHIRYSLRGGTLASTEVQSMWGGIPITASIPAPIPTDGGSSSLGAIIRRASAVAGSEPMGFSVFNQDHSMINTTASGVPVADPGMMVNYYLFGSGARIPVPCDPGLASLAGGRYDQPVGWDYTAGRLVSVAAGPLQLPVEVFTVAISGSMVAVLDVPTGRINWNRNGACALIKI
jgi:hypothetical protein